MELFVTGGLFILVAVLVRYRFKGVKIILPKEMEPEEELLVLPSSTKYEEETQEEIMEFNQQLDEKGITEEMKVKIIEFNRKFQERENYWENQCVQLNLLIEERKVFITTETMYPRNYALALSDLEVTLHKAEDYKNKNPLKRDYSVEEMILREKDLVKEFLKTKKKVEEGMEQMKEYEKKLKGKKEQVDYFSEKQKMYLCLMNGDTKKTKESLRKIMKKIEK